MKTINFKDMVKALAKDGTDLINGLNSASAHLLHMAVGVSGEVGELIEGVLNHQGRDNQVEELGDIEFYLEGICNHIGPFNNNYGNEIEDGDKSHTIMLNMSIHAAGLLDAVKKHAIYEKELDMPEVLKQIDGLAYQMSKFRWISGISRQECLTANIAKLGKRYADGQYSNNQAQTRADKS